MTNILILGGLGFIGSNIIEAFLEEDEPYKIIVFDFPGMINIFGTKVKMVYGDFNNTDDLDAVLKHNNIDIVIHLISTTIPGSSNDNIIYDIESNLIPSVRLLNLIIKYKILKIIFLSSGGTVYGPTEYALVNETHPTYPISSHGVIKLGIEKYLHLFHQLYGLNFLILRAGNPYGPYQRSDKQGIINVFLRKMIHNEKLIVRGDGSAVRDYFYIKDLASIIKSLIVNNIQNEVINIGSGTGVTINQIIDILKTLNNKIEVEFTFALNSDITKIVLDIKKLNSLIKFNFCGLEEGILKTYNYMLTEMHK